MSDQGEQPVSIKDRIGAVLAPEPPPQEAAPEPEQEAEQVEETPEPQEAPEATPDEWVEIELEGEKLQVPPKFSKAFLQERDYTQKRQADAAYRNLVETRERQLQAREQAIGQLQPLYGQMHAINQSIEQYQRIDWETLKANDPLEHSAKRTDYLLALQQRNELGQYIEQGHGYVNQQSEAAIAEQIRAAEPLVRKAVPDFGPEKDAKLTKLALDKGLTPYEIRAFVATRPGAVEILDAAHKWFELQAQKAQLPKKAQTLSPVAKPGAKTTHVSSEAASYRKAQEDLKKSKGRDSNAIRTLLRAKLRAT